MMDEVYVVTVQGEAYDGTDFVCLASSPEAAVEKIKAKFGKPYKVTWGDLTGLTILGLSRYQIEGDFELVPHYSIEHKATFYITPQAVA